MKQPAQEAGVVVLEQRYRDAPSGTSFLGPYIE